MTANFANCDRLLSSASRTSSPINYLQRAAGGRVTYSPSSEQLQLVLDEFSIDDSENAFNWLDSHALAADRAAEAEAEQKAAIAPSPFLSQSAYTGIGTVVYKLSARLI